MPGFSADGVIEWQSALDPVTSPHTKGLTTMKHLGERVIVLVDPATNGEAGATAAGRITCVHPDGTVNVKTDLDVAGSTGYAAHIALVPDYDAAIKLQAQSPTLNIAFWPDLLADDDAPAPLDAEPADIREANA